MDNKIRLIIRNTPRYLLEWEKEGTNAVYIAEREGDPHFSGFLDSVLNREIEVSELEIKGSVRDIIETRWDKYLRLVNWIKEYGQVTSRMCRLFDYSGRRRIDVDTVYTTIDQLFEASLIFDMPKGWEQWVPLGDNMNIEHLRRIGEEVVISGDDIEKYDYEDSYSESMRDRPLHDFFYSLYDRDNSSQDMKRLRTLLIGMRRSALLISAARSTDDMKTLPIQSLRWRVLLLAIRDEGLRIKSEIYNAIATLAGEFRPDLATTLRFDYFKIQDNLTSDMYMGNDNAQFLYNLVLPHLPKNIGLDALGLGSLRSSGAIVTVEDVPDLMVGEGIYNQIAYIIPIVHIRLLGAIQHALNELDSHYVMGVDPNRKEEEIRQTVHLFDQYLSTLAIERIIEVIRNDPSFPSDSNLKIYEETFADLVRDGVYGSNYDITTLVLMRAVVTVSSEK